jgi:hypothetical protein
MNGEPDTDDSTPQHGGTVTPKTKKPKAVGLIRTDISGLHAPRHAVEIRRHAEQLGYHYLYTVRPPDNRDTDPVVYALGITAGVQAATLVVYDLSTVDNTPARVCEVCDLETVSPPTTWTATRPGFSDPAHTHPDHPLTVAEAQRIVQQHKTCRAIACARKATALSCLVRAGKLVPPAVGPRERAAARGLRFPPVARGTTGLRRSRHPNFAVRPRRTPSARRRHARTCCPALTEHSTRTPAVTRT